MKWYRKAAEQGVARAQFNLGECCYDGVGIAQDKAEAVKWFQKAAEQRARGSTRRFAEDSREH